MKSELPIEQEDKPEENPVRSDASAVPKSRARFQKFLSYMAGDMAPFGKWMESM